MANFSIENFDFLIGHWSVENRRLKERLVQSQAWEVFTADMKTYPILNGLALMDEMRTDYFGDNFVGLSIRMVNPDNQVWTIYWADTANPGNYLKEQVKGKFDQGVGTFYGNELYQNKEVQLRFTWKMLDANTAQWEQSYFDENQKVWEVNWIMVFTPVAS